MSTPRKLNPEIQKMLQSIAANPETSPLSKEDSTRLKGAALYASYAHINSPLAQELRPGDLVRWKPRMKYTLFPAYEEAMIVVEVLRRPVLTVGQRTESPYFRLPENLILGCWKNEGFHCWHYDGRRFEKVPSERS